MLRTRATARRQLYLFFPRCLVISCQLSVEKIQRVPETPGSRLLTGKIMNGPKVYLRCVSNFFHVFNSNLLILIHVSSPTALKPF